MSSKRLAYLEKVTADGATDAMPWYGLALEYAGLDRVDDALHTFEKLRALHATYVPAYLMCGQMLAKVARADEAKRWLDEGIVQARATGNTHALGELEDARSALS